jgi:hypothetical protein
MNAELAAVAMRPAHALKATLSSAWQNSTSQSSMATRALPMLKWRQATWRSLATKGRAAPVDRDPAAAGLLAATAAEREIAFQLLMAELY